MVLMSWVSFDGDVDQKTNLSLGNLGAGQLVRSQQQGDLIIPDVRRETFNATEKLELEKGKKG